MQYVKEVNGYKIYKYSEATCEAHYYSYPCYGAFATYEENVTPENEECSMGNLETLTQWCEEH